MDIRHVEAAADAVVEDVVRQVKAHPAYGQIVGKLTEEALTALAASAGL